MVFEAMHGAKAAVWWTDLRWAQVMASRRPERCLHSRVARSVIVCPVFGSDSDPGWQKILVRGSVGTAGIFGHPTLLIAAC